MDEKTAKKYLGIIDQRTTRKINGAKWQINQFRKNNGCFEDLSRQYFNCQESKLPVHEWALAQ
ncbi:MAG: hypothetical protein R2827_09840 [Bdellovibrionales bacterium]